MNYYNYNKEHHIELFEWLKKIIEEGKPPSEINSNKLTILAKYSNIVRDQFEYNNRSGYLKSAKDFLRLNNFYKFTECLFETNDGNQNMLPCMN